MVENNIKYARFLTKEPVDGQSNLRITVASRKKVVRSLIWYFAYVLLFPSSSSGPESDSVFLTTQHLPRCGPAKPVGRDLTRERKGGGPEGDK